MLKVFITAVAGVILLHGCGSAEPSKTITFWHHQTAGDGPKLIQQAVDRFQQDTPGIQVEVVAINNDAYKTKIKVAVGAGNAPCVFPTWGGGPLHEYIKANQIADLTAFMMQDNYKDRFPASAFDSITFAGRIYGVPVENTSIAVVIYNKATFQKYNLTPPATDVELRQIMRTLKENGVAPFALANKPKWPGSMFFMYFADRLGGPDAFAKAEAREGAGFESPVFIEAGRRVQALVKESAFQEGFNGLDYDAGATRALLYSGKAAMELMGTWAIGAMKGENPAFYRDNLAFFPFPAVSGGAGDPKNLIGTVGDNFYSVSTTCKEPAEAFRLIQYLIDDTSVAARAKAGRVPPVKGFTTDDPILQQVIDLVAQAPHVQLWYDQQLPPAVGEAHKDTTQALFSQSMTPEQAARRMEEAAKEYYGAGGASGAGRSLNQ
jgi:raffinose/stachyose/melibiose transport system substrate-binding protein